MQAGAWVEGKLRFSVLCSWLLANGSRPALALQKGYLRSMTEMMVVVGLVGESESNDKTDWPTRKARVSGRWSFSYL